MAFSLLAACSMPPPAVPPQWWLCWTTSQTWCSSMARGPAYPSPPQRCSSGGWVCRWAAGWGIWRHGGTWRACCCVPALTPACATCAPPWLSQAAGAVQGAGGVCRKHCSGVPPLALRCVHAACLALLCSAAACPAGSPACAALATACLCLPASRAAAACLACLPTRRQDSVPFKAGAHLLCPGGCHLLLLLGPACCCSLSRLRPARAFLSLACPAATHSACSGRSFWSATLALCMPGG